MILLIDNYDSFVFNLARYFERLSMETRVVRNDAIDAAGIRMLRPAAIVLSPGPCTPSEAGNSLDIVRELHAELPILGVCLGHQTIAAALGGSVVRAAAPLHGQASEIEHDGRGMFQDLPSPMRVGRYHSLIVEHASLPAELTITATTGDGAIMAFQHARYPVFGVQFHPESILTEHGYRLLANFLRAANLTPTTDATLGMSTELIAPTSTAPPLPSRPVTF